MPNDEKMKILISLREEISAMCADTTCVWDFSEKNGIVNGWNQHAAALDKIITRKMKE